MSLACPQCPGHLREVTADAVTGYRLVLDQCPSCGGVWVDRWELFPLSAEAVAQLDPADEGALQAPTPVAAVPLACPRCRAPMRHFRDPTLPADARIDRCPNCEGMWLNRGELRRVRSRARPRRGAPLADPALDRLARAASDPKTWPTVPNLDDAMHGTGHPDDDAAADLGSHAAWLIVRALIRLLLRV